jgi:hypothetical protein
MLRAADRFTLERGKHVAQPVLAVRCVDGEVKRFAVEDPQQLFLEVLNVLGPWLAQPGTLPEVSAGVELFDQFREVMSDLLAEKEEA